MRTSGILLLILGFGWILFECLMGFTVRQYSGVHFHVGRLAALPAIRIEAAARELADLGLELQDGQRILLIPSAMMLVGGIILSVRK